ncbi:MAG: RHS repeat-associated core domain-containing protein, partial [Phycisphaeraceae bacterium]
GDLIAQHDDDDYDTPAYDAQFSPTDLIDDAGSSAQRYRHTTFGLPAPGSTPSWCDLSLDQWDNLDEQGWEQMPACSAGLFGFGGQRGYYHDPETELYLLGGGTGSAPANGVTSKGAGRFYDPELGRFLTQDPLGLASGDINLYRYVNNNPVDNIDPSGNAADDGNQYTKETYRTTEDVQRLVGIEVDGLYDTETENALKPFQRALIDAGFMDPKTKSGRPSDDGKWGDQTERAYQAYLASLDQAFKEAEEQAAARREANRIKRLRADRRDALRPLVRRLIGMSPPGGLSAPRPSMLGEIDTSWKWQGAMDHVLRDHIESVYPHIEGYLDEGLGFEGVLKGISDWEAELPGGVQRAREERRQWLVEEAERQRKSEEFWASHPQLTAGPEVSPAMQRLYDRQAEAVRREARGELGLFSNTPEDYDQMIERQARLEHKREYLANHPWGPVGAFGDAMFNPAWDGTGNANDLLMAMAPFTAAASRVPGQKATYAPLPLGRTNTTGLPLVEFAQVSPLHPTGRNVNPLQSLPRVSSSSVVINSTLKDFMVGSKVSQKQLRHIKGRQEYRGGGFLESITDAQKVLDNFHVGDATIIGKTRQGFPVVRVYNVTGTNVNVAAGFPNQPTNVFIIKGTVSPSVVPANPNWGG